MKIYKMLFTNILILSTLITISSYSWLSMWMGLEINLLSIIPLMNSNKNIFLTEAMMKYFISQTMASMILLFSMLMTLNFPQKFMIMLLNSSLFMKMGASPFHYWFPQVMEGLTWNLALIMLTWQKIAPFIMLSYNMNTYSLFILVIISSSIIGSILGLNQISLRKILTFSSINHIAWMTSSLMNSLLLWSIYFIIYSMISVSIMLFLTNYNIFNFKNLILKLNNNKNLKMFFLINFFSLGGLPPFLGFLPKWMTINYLQYQHMYILSLILIITSLITLFFYIRISMSSMIMKHNNQFISNLKKNKWLILIINFISLSSLAFTTLIFNLF